MTDTVTDTRIRISRDIADSGYHADAAHILDLYSRVEEDEVALATLRRFAETIWFERGRSILTVEQLFGDLRTNQRYLAGVVHSAVEAGRRADFFIIGEDTELVPPVDSPTVDFTNLLPIGPEHPGWREFWVKVHEQAHEAGYVDEFNKIAEALDAPEDLIKESRDTEIVVRYTLDVTMRIEVDVDTTQGEYDDGEVDIDQDAIDSAIHEFVRRENADYEVYDSELR